MPENIVTYWDRLVADAPGALAFIDGSTDQRWTRQELDQQAVRFAHTLPRAISGVGVVLAEPNGPAWIAALLALLRNNAVVALADPMEPPGTLRATAKAIGAGWLYHRGVLNEQTASRRVRQRAYCILKLTSGSTGVPKALRFTHSQMIADGRQVCSSMGITPADMNLGVIPFGHSYGLGNIVIPLLAQGTAVLCASTPLPHALADHCERHRPTVFPAVPSLLHALVRSDIAAEKLGSLRLVISAGSVLLPSIASAFRTKFGQQVHGFYGSSETGGITYDRTGESTSIGSSVGIPLDGVRLEFRKGGRFSVESPAVMGSGRYSPPDHGRLSESGELILLGRSGRTVKVGGRRLNLTEVEQSLLTIQGVRQAWAVAADAAERPVRAIVETELPALALRAELAKRIAAWKIPERLVVVPQIPMTARGKIDRQRALQLLERAAPA